MAFRKVVYCDLPTRKTTKKEKQQSGTSVDLIVQDGQEWIKVSTTNEHRLMMELAEKGFGAVDSEDEGEEEELDEDDMVEILHAAHGLRKASEATRVRYKVGLSMIFLFHSPLQKLSTDIRFPDLEMGNKNVERMGCSEVVFMSSIENG